MKKHDELENPRKEKEELIKVMTEEKTEAFYELAKAIHACDEKQRVHYGGSLTVLTESALYSNRQYDPQIIYEQNEYRQVFEITYQRALQSLTKTQKRRWLLFYEEAKSYSEIAVFEDVDESSIRESVHGAQKKLQKFLKNFYKIPPKLALKSAY